MPHDAGHAERRAEEIAKPRRPGPAWMLAALIVMGIAIRLEWMASNPDKARSSGEAFNVAVAFARTGQIADAFAVGQGPTAHLTPLAPMIAGTVYRMLGIDTPASNSVLTGWSLALAFGSFLLFYRIFGRLGAPVAGRLLGVGFMALIPMNNIYFETTLFRIWEGGLAVFVAAIILDTLLRLDAASRVTMRDVGGVALLTATCLFISPPLGVAAYLGGLLLMVRKVDARRWPRTIAIVGFMTALVLGPWLVRNIIVMDRPILLRDNIGLEMAQAFHDKALTTDNIPETFWARHKQIHPFRKGYAAMQAAGGEAAYAEALGVETRAWIAAHPTGAARLALEHTLAMMFPPPSSWDPPDLRAWIKAAILSLVTLLGLAGLIAGWRRREIGYGYAGLFALVPVIPYALVQPDLRYRYIIAALLAFLAFDFLARALKTLRPMSST